MRAWSNGLADWIEGSIAFISVAFSWRLPDAYQRASWYRAQGLTVRAGGPAVWARKSYLAGVAELGGEVEALPHHNPDATIASRGCPVGCYFCVVPQMEGRAFTLLPDFTPRPILCDNNLSALPVEYQDHIIRRYQQAGVPLLDANSGFEPRTFDEGTYQRWRGINRGPWRFALDETRELPDVERMMKILRAEPARDKRVYVLIGNEPMAACHERIQKVIEWGGEPHCQPLMALNTLERRPMVRYDWTEERLIDMARWANRKIWRVATVHEYRPRKNQPAPFAAVAL